MIGLLSPEEIESLLKRHRIGRLGVCLEDRPYVVPITYVYDGTTVYTASGPGQKIDAMRARPRVCLQIDEIDASGDWRSVVADGVYEELTEDEERRTMLVRLRPTWAGQSDQVLQLPAAIVVFRIRLVSKTGRFGREGVRDAHGNARMPESPGQSLPSLPARPRDQEPRYPEGDDPAEACPPRTAALRSGHTAFAAIPERY